MSLARHRRRLDRLESVAPSDEWRLWLGALREDARRRDAVLALVRLARVLAGTDDRFGGAPRAPETSDATSDAASDAAPGGVPAPQVTSVLQKLPPLPPGRYDGPTVADPLTSPDAIRSGDGRTQGRTPTPPARPRRAFDADAAPHPWPDRHTWLTFEQAMRLKPPPEPPLPPLVLPQQITGPLPSPRTPKGWVGPWSNGDFVFPSYAAERQEAGEMRERLHLEGLRRRSK